MTSVQSGAVTRNHGEIVARINELKPEDYFGFQSADLLAFLPWDQAKQFLKPDANESEWRAHYPVVEPPPQAVRGYLPYAWDKANNRRGISVMRSLEHLKAWLWLAGYEAKMLADLFDDYTHYGKGQLVFAAELVGFNWRAEDDGKWVNDPSEAPLSDGALHVEINKWIELANIHRKE